MLTKEKYLYQVKLILDYLPEEEYKLIPEETIDYIENNFEYDENITIDPSIPLEKQKIDNKTYEFLDKILKKIEVKNIEENNNIKVNSNVSKTDENEIIRLNNLIKEMKEENEKLPEAKRLLEGYKQELKIANEEIEKLKRVNMSLYDSIQKLPKLIRKIFLKDINSKYLLENKK